CGSEDKRRTSNVERRTSNGIDIGRSTFDVRCSTFCFSRSQIPLAREIWANRAGSVLLIVLVVVALLALGAYTFAELMVVEAEATATYGREGQARSAADSGIELAASLLEKRYEQNPQNLYSDPQQFEGILVR